MIEFLTALFAGAMLPVIPMLLIRALEAEDLENERFKAGALIALAVLAWPVAAYLFFLAPIAGLIGIAIGGFVVWRVGRKPRILFQEISEEPVDVEEVSLADADKSVSSEENSVLQKEASEDEEKDL